MESDLGELARQQHDSNHEPAISREPRFRPNPREDL